MRKSILVPVSPKGLHGRCAVKFSFASTLKLGAVCALLDTVSRFPSWRLCVYTALPSSLHRITYFFLLLSPSWCVLT